MFNLRVQGQGSGRYSAKKMLKPINFYCEAPAAKGVFIAGEFNGWSESSHSFRKQPDGRWFIQVELAHGHHQYVFIVDGQRTLDPFASGVGRDLSNRRVSLIAVS